MELEEFSNNDNVHDDDEDDSNIYYILAKCSCIVLNSSHSLYHNPPNIYEVDNIVVSIVMMTQREEQIGNCYI